MVNNEIIRQCQEEFLKRYGGLNDIPHELANTIANPYYEFLRNKKEFEESKYIIPSLLEGENLFENFPQWISDHMV
jgi:adenosine deaminase